MKVVVGLGNPGRKYAGTRHNVGFDVVAELARRHGGGAVRQRFHAELVDVNIGGENVVLMAPQTYMNLSGRAVGAIVQFHKLEPADVLVVCDDLNLPLGRLRLRKSGSAGGQKGLKDVIGHLGTEDVPRLRIGIDRPPGGGDTVSYVLQTFRPDEREVIRDVIDAAADAAAAWVTESPEDVMNRVNALDLGSGRGRK